MVAFAPHDDAVLTPTARLAFRLASKARIHDLHTAYGASVALHVPAPHRDSIPLLESEHLLGFRRFVVDAVGGIVFIGHDHYLHSKLTQRQRQACVTGGSTRILY